MTDWHQSLLDLYQQGQTEQAIAAIHQAYQADSALCDGFAVLGGVQRAAKNWQAAHELMLRDLELGRMSCDWQLRYAEVLAELGQEAEAIDLIERVYAQQPQAVDAYARLGWVKARTKDWEAAYALMVEDFKAKRLSPTWQVHFAQVVARCGDEARAVALVEQAYGLDENLRDGFARLGWIHQETKAWEAAWALAVRDEQAGRLSPVWQARLALLHGQRGQFNQAEGLVEAAYAADPNLKDGYGRLGLIKAENTDWAGAVELVRKDQALNRQSPSSAVDESLAQLYGRLALTRKADDKDREWANFEQETEEVVSQAFPYIKLAVSNAVLNHKQIWQCCIPKSASTYLHRILNTLWKQDCCLGTSVPYFRDRMQEPEVYTVFQRIKNSQKPYFSGHLHQKYTTYLHQFFLSKQSELLGGVIVQTRDLKDTIVSIKEHTDRVCLEGQVGPWIVTAPSLWPNRLPTTPT